MTFQQEAQNSYSLPNSRLVFFGLMSVVFTLTFFLAPLPLALVFIFYGRLRGLFVGMMSLVVWYLLSSYWGEGIGLFINAAGFVFAILISEVVNRDISPIKGVLAIGGSFILLAFSYFAMVLDLRNTTLKDAVVERILKNQEAIERQKDSLKVTDPDNDFIKVLDQPEVFAKMIITVMPGYFTIGIFGILWMNFFLALKYKRVIEMVQKRKLKFSADSLLKFKVPDHFVWLVITSFALVIWGNQLGQMYEILGYTTLMTLGVFYFFQGFGVYIAFLDNIKLEGIMRSLLVVLTVFMASQVIAVIGFADMFINFRRFFQKKS